MRSDAENRPKSYVYYNGKPCEYLGQANIFGRTYYDIVLNGVKKTVPASACSSQNQKEKEKKGQKNNESKHL